MFAQEVSYVSFLLILSCQSHGCAAESSSDIYTTKTITENNPKTQGRTLKGFNSVCPEATTF